MTKEIIRTTDGPTPIGPYSQAVKLGNLVFVSGMGPIDPATGNLVGGSAEDQTRRVMLNLKAVLEAAGASLDSVVKTTCFLSDLNNFKAFNGVYGEFFTTNPPARSTIQAARLPMDIAVEVEAIAEVL